MSNSGNIILLLIFIIAIIASITLVVFDEYLAAIMCMVVAGCIPPLGVKMNE